VIRLMVLKHVRGWSYESLEREVRANMVYRMFTRIGAEKVPDAKTMGRLGQAWRLSTKLCLGDGLTARLRIETETSR
jgi:hypothetical protein